MAWSRGFRRCGTIAAVIPDPSAAPGSWPALGDDRRQRVIGALKRRRALRAGLVQLVYSTIAVAAAIVLVEIDAGPTVKASGAVPLLFGIAGGFISFVALVFSLLFLVVQFSNTTISPRLTIFRDDPFVWRTFGLFVAVFVFCSTAAITIGGERADVSVIVPIVAVVLVVITLMLVRALQTRALRLLQLPLTIEIVRARGAQVLAMLYPAPLTGTESASELPPPIAELRWERSTATLRQIDLPRLYEEAHRVRAVLRLHVAIGAELRRGALVMTVHRDEPGEPPEGALETLETGVDRSFAQDPLFAFRLLTDIADRALSAAINDPETAVQAIAAVHDLLSQIADRDLAIDQVADEQGKVRVVLQTPGWEHFVAAAVDEVAYYASGAPTARARLDLLLTELTERVPDERRPALMSRLSPG